MNENVRATFHGQLIHKLTSTSIRSGALAARPDTTNKAEINNAVTIGLHCHLLSKYIKALEEWVPPPALEALQAEMTQYAQEKAHVDLAPKQ